VRQCSLSELPPDSPRERRRHTQPACNSLTKRAARPLGADTPAKTSTTRRRDSGKATTDARCRDVWRRRLRVEDVPDARAGRPHRCARLRHVRRDLRQRSRRERPRRNPATSRWDARVCANAPRRSPFPEAVSRSAQTPGVARVVEVEPSLEAGESAGALHRHGVDVEVERKEELAVEVRGKLVGEPKRSSTDLHE